MAQLKTEIAEAQCRVWARQGELKQIEVALEVIKDNLPLTLGVEYVSDTLINRRWECAKELREWKAKLEELEVQNN